MERVQLLETQINHAIPYLDHSCYNILILYHFNDLVRRLTDANMSQQDAVQTLGRTAKAVTCNLISHWKSAVQKEHRHLMKNSNLGRSEVDRIIDELSQALRSQKLSKNHVSCDLKRERVHQQPAHIWLNTLLARERDRFPNCNPVLCQHEIQRFEHVYR